MSEKMYQILADFIKSVRELNCEGLMGIRNAIDIAELRVIYKNNLTVDEYLNSEAGRMITITRQYVMRYI